MLLEGGVEFKNRPWMGRPHSTHKGATLHLEVLLKPGEDLPRISVTAAHGAPSYIRRGNSQKGSTTVSLSGLGPGRFTVSANQTMSMGRDRFEFTIESDGQSDVKQVWDLSK